MSFSYKIVIKDIITEYEKSTISNLYLPIIGTQSMSLYFALINEGKNLKKLNNPKFEIERLHKITTLSCKSFNDSIKKLEAMRLVKTFVSKRDESRRYTVMAPLDPSEFFENEIYEKTLTKKIGIENVEAIKFILKDKIDFFDSNEEMEDVTAEFLDVFKDDIEDIATQDAIDFKNTSFIRLKHRKKTLFENIINVDEFQAKLVSKKINFDLKNKNNAEVINWALTIKNFNEKTLFAMIANSYDKKLNIFDFQIFSSLVNDEIIKSNCKSIIDKNFKDTSKFNIFDTDEFILSLTGYKPDLAVKEMIKNLIEQFNISKGGINYLIHYSFEKNKKIVINYILKIAQTLKEKKLLSTEEVISWLNSVKNSSNVSLEKNQKDNRIISKKKTIPIKLKTDELDLDSSPIIFIEQYEFDRKNKVSAEEIDLLFS